MCPKRVAAQMGFFSGQLWTTLYLSACYLRC